MPRRKGFISLMNQIARESAKTQREEERRRAKAQKLAEENAKNAFRLKIQQDQDIERVKREIERNSALSLKEKERLIKQAEKEANQRYLEAMNREVEERNAELEKTMQQLLDVLPHTFSINDTISFDSLRIREPFPMFSPPKHLTQAEQRPTKDPFVATLKRPGFFEETFFKGKERFDRDVQEAKKKYQAAVKEYEQREQERQNQIEKLKQEYNREREAYLLKVRQRDQEVDELKAAYLNCDPDAVVSYCMMVLERSEYPDGFPQEFRVAYVPQSRELVIEYELPNVDIIPTVEEYRYVRTKDIIEEKPRKVSEVKELYQDLVASICLRTIHEVYEADQGNQLEMVAFNGFVQTIDPATGQDIRPYLISIRTTKSAFLSIDLRRIDKRACLRNLGAQVSPRPAEMQAVKPIIEFDMVDKRFVEQSDIISDLESRPNLMELSPFEFENLVSNLFSRMGLETKQTRSTKDNGVDAVAFDQRPVLGGKVVIQAKRYKNTVGVSAVRDLYGTMMNEGANKGILVTTSGYGPDAYEFAKDKPIELIDGGGLLYHMEQVGVKARIIFPED